MIELHNVIVSRVEVQIEADKAGPDTSSTTAQPRADSLLEGRERGSLRQHLVFLQTT